MEFMELKWNCIGYVIKVGLCIWCMYRDFVYNGLVGLY